jgi:hypothetical protein
MDSTPSLRFSISRDTCVSPPAVPSVQSLGRSRSGEHLHSVEHCCRFQQLFRSDGFCPRLQLGRSPSNQPAGVAHQASCRTVFRSLAVIQVNPGSSKVIKISAEAKTSAGPFEALSFRTRACVIIVGPLFSRGGMRAQAEDRQLAVTSTFATIYWSLLRSKFALVWMAYLRVQCLAQDKLVDAILPTGILPKTNLIQ